MASERLKEGSLRLSQKLLLGRRPVRNSLPQFGSPNLFHSRLSCGEGTFTPPKPGLGCPDPLLSRGRWRRLGWGAPLNFRPCIQGAAGPRLSGVNGGLHRHLGTRGFEEGPDGLFLTLLEESGGPKGDTADWRAVRVSNPGPRGGWTPVTGPPGAAPS